MSDLRETVVTWADRRIDEVLAAPRMWGSPEVVEMQVLQLLEIRAVALRPTQEYENPRRVLDTYLAFLRERYPAQPAQPLFQLVEHLDPGKFGEALRCFREALGRTILTENPFEHSPLAIRLSFGLGRQPTTSAFTGYYEEFRRATRAVVRAGDKATGRAKKDIEFATDFALEDSIVSAPNGRPGEVLLRLGHGPGQLDWTAEQRVRDALSTIMTLVEWAGTEAEVGDLRLDDVAERTRTAVQALRLLPRRGIVAVAIGGRLVARSKPVELRAAHEKRFLEVIGAEAAPEDFDASEEIRAIDLDRGLLVLGRRERVHCYVRAEALGEVAEVGVRARVVGRRYRPLGGRAFVLADTVEVERSGTEE